MESSKIQFFPSLSLLHVQSVLYYLSVAEEELVHAYAVAALQLAIGAHGLVGHEVGQRFSRLREDIAVLVVRKQKASYMSLQGEPSA